MVYTLSDGTQMTRRKKIVLTGAVGGAQSDYQLKLTALWAAAMQADYDDIRFTQADMQTLIDAWLESKVNSTTADIWVEFLTTPADGVEETEAYMYFGNIAAASDWDIGATFLLGDDFPGSSIDTGKWTVTGAVTVSNSEAVLNQDDILKSIATFGFETAVTVKSKADEQDISFVGYYTDAANRTLLSNSDGVANDDFDNIMGFFYKSGAWPNAQENNGWSDFRNTYYQYEIERISTSSLAYRQGTDSNIYVNSTYIATGDMSVMMQAWDSSQASTLTCDWVFVRKCVANPPTYAFGAEEHQRRTPMMM